MNAGNHNECNQIEMAAMIAERPGHYTEQDLAAHFIVSGMTIRRYKRGLKEQGIDVYSRKRFYHVDLKLHDLNRLITRYLAYGAHEVIRNLKLIESKFKGRTLALFVNITKAIREKKMIEIEYKTGEKGYSWREVTPLSFHNSGKTFYLIALHHDIAKFFLLEHINDVKFTDRRTVAKHIPEPLELFRNTWGTFTGGEVKDIRLLFRDEFKEYLSGRFWQEDQKITVTEDGVELHLKMKLSYEFISWVMGWGKHVKVLEPEELRREVVKRAKEILEQYIDGIKY